jgi:hypothetical protein
MATKNATATYNFHAMGQAGIAKVTATVIVETPAVMTKCSDGKSYLGYHIVSGKVDYTYQSKQESLPIAKHVVGDGTQVLWADSSGGNGGSSYGIDPTGLNFGGGAPGALSWNKPEKTAFAAGLLVGSGYSNVNLTLATEVWPPK